MNPEVRYLIGPPACGKSTYCEMLFKNNPDRNYVIISTDQIIEENMKLLNLSYMQTIMTVKEGPVNKKLIDKLTDAIDRKQNLLIDRTNLNQRARYFTMRHLTDDYYRIGVVFYVNEDTLKFRLRRREILTGKHIPEIVVERMKNEFHFPEGREFHKIELIYN